MFKAESLFRFCLGLSKYLLVFIADKLLMHMSLSRSDLIWI